MIVERLPGETLVYDQSRDTAHCLSDAAATVFELCDGTKTKPALATLTAKRLGRSFDQAELDTVLKELQAKALLADDPARAGVSRRQVVLAGGGVVAASLITTIVAPLPAAAQSPTPPGNPGGPGTPCQTQPDCDPNLNCEGGSCCVPNGGNCTSPDQCCPIENADIACAPESDGAAPVCITTD